MMHKGAAYWTGDMKNPLIILGIHDYSPGSITEENRQDLWTVVVKVFLTLEEIEYILKNNLTTSLSPDDPTKYDFSYAFKHSATPRELIEASDPDITKAGRVLLSVFEKKTDGEKYIAECEKVFEEFKQTINAPPPPDFDARRFEHMAIFAPSGSGKTNLISNLIYDDFAKVARNEASVIVMESNADLAQSIAHLVDFAPGGRLAGKLIYIDVADVEYPVALNLFDVGKAEGATALEKEILHNTAVALLDYIFTALLQTELTGRQRTLFNFVVFLMLEIPGATIDTMVDVLQKGGASNYGSNLLRCNKDTQDFFATRFNTAEWAKTKTEIEDRLYAVKRNQTLARIFSSTRTRLNLFEEIGRGRVIIINASQAVLGQEGAEQFGRFWIAMILMAAQRRQLVEKGKRLPTYVYLDECQDFVRSDAKIPVILDQARKFGVGVTLATQRMDSISPPIVSAIVGGTAIKFAAQLSSSHAAMLAQDMRTDASFIMNQKPYHFAMFVRGMQKPEAVTYPERDFLKMPRMSAQEFRGVQTEMRNRYCNTSHFIDPQSRATPIRTETLELQTPVRMQGTRRPKRKDVPEGW